MKLKKGFFAHLTALFLTAGLLAGALALFKDGGEAAYAATSWSPVEDALLDIEGTTLRGFKPDAAIPDKYELVIPESVTAIADNAFESQSGIVRVVLPASLVSIGSDAFRDCTGIVEAVSKSSEITLIENGTNYGRVSFYAKSIINVPDSASGEAPTNIVYSGDYAFCKANLTEDKGNYLIGYLGDSNELSLPADFSGAGYSVYSYAFNGLDIIGVDAANANITAIGDYAFAECSHLINVKLPETVISIGYAAFMRDAALTTVNMPAALTVIDDYAFNECAALTGTLNFPAGLKSIGSLAFYGCGITGVDFAEPATDTVEKSLTLNRQAFMNCTSLAVVELPEQLDAMYLQVFYGCTGLQYVYIPDGVTFSARAASGDAIVYFDSNTWLVFGNYSAYNTARNANYVKNHAARMTFTVTVNYYGGENGALTASSVRLANREYNLMQDANKSWSYATGNYFPTQVGYSESVWYSEASYGSRVGVADVTAMLDGIAENKIDLYAKYLAKPALTVKALTYTGTEFNPGDFIDGASLSNDYNVVFADNAQAIDAGDYNIVVSVANESAYGAWAEPVTQQVTVNRKTVDLANEAVWSAQGGSAFGDNRIYEYRNASGDASRFLLSPVAPSGYTLYSVYDLKNSVTNRTGNNITAIIAPNPAFRNITYSDNTASAENKYTSTATISADGNYLFFSGGATEIVNATLGLKISVNANGTSATLEKTWYIVNSLNELYMPGTSNPYSISGWKYNDGAAANPVAPDLHYGNENEITFNITGTVQNINGSGVWSVNNADYSRFGYYINTSMPAGTYTVIFNIPTAENNGETLYAHQSDPYTFTVDTADFKEEWAQDAYAKLIDGEYRYAANTIQLYRYGVTGALNPDLEVWTNAVMSSFNPEKSGYWAEAENAGYSDARFEVSYNLLRMPIRRYYTFDELSRDNTLARPVAADVYTVYYQLSAKNYKPLVNEADNAEREHYKFKVTVYDVVKSPVIEDIRYSANGSTQYVAPNPHYTIEYVGQGNNSPVYTEVGDGYKVKLNLNTPETYRWENGAKTALEITFSVLPALNNVVVELSYSGWNYGDYGADEARKPVFGVNFVDKNDPGFYTFTLISDKDGAEYVYGASGNKGFGGAPVGTYTLRATAKGSTNWEPVTREIKFEIYRGYNSWTVTPSVMQWTYKSFDKNVNHILGTAKIADARDGKPAVVFSVSTDAAGEKPVKGLEAFYAVDGVVLSDLAADYLKNLKVGTYYLWAHVADTEQYRELDGQAVFAVAVADNCFDEAPVIEAWIVGKYDPEVNTISAKAHFGSQIDYVITVAGESDNVVYDSVKGINKLADAKVGLYELKAYVANTDDYKAIEGYSVLFNVFEKTGLPWWAVLLIVVAVLAAVVIIFYILHEKGVLQMLTGKMIVALRTRVTVDATIAAVRANKVAAESRRSIAKARLQDANEARRRKMEEQKNMSLEEQAAALDEQAREAAEGAEKLDKKATRIKKRADRMRKQAERAQTAANNESAGADDAQSSEIANDSINNDQNPGQG